MVSSSPFFGEIKPPEPLEKGYGGSLFAGGLVKFLSNIFKLAALAAGLYAIINFILAGFGIITASGDPEKTSQAQSKIWNSVIGMVLIVCSFAFAALLGWILFQNPNAILNLKIYGPGD